MPGIGRLRPNGLVRRSTECLAIAVLRGIVWAATVAFRKHCHVVIWVDVVDSATLAIAVAHSGGLLARRFTSERFPTGTLEQRTGFPCVFTVHLASLLPLSRGRWTGGPHHHNFSFLAAWILSQFSSTTHTAPPRLLHASRFWKPSYYVRFLRAAAAKPGIPNPRQRALCSPGHWRAPR